jgi:hypothetical protein
MKLFIIFIAALLFRAETVLVLNIQPESDYAAYQMMAQSLLAGNGLTDGENQAFMSAGYPLFILFRLRTFRKQLAGCPVDQRSSWCN